jgi:hypothetical protein
MGLLEKFRAETRPEGDWVPPMYGTCECEGHIEDVLELRIPLAGAAPGVGEPGDMAVWALVTSGGLATVPLAEESRFLTNGVSIERQGPFHWKVLAGERIAPFLQGGDHERLVAALRAHPEIGGAMWIQRQRTLVVGGPRLCANGVQCAVVQALLSASSKIGAVAAHGRPA